MEILPPDLQSYLDNHCDPEPESATKKGMDGYCIGCDITASVDGRQGLLMKKISPGVSKPKFDRNACVKLC